LPEHASILNVILRSIFIGFGFLVPFISLINTNNIPKLKFKDLFVLTAVQAVRVGGIIYFILFIIESYLRQDYVKLYGNYWILYWFSPLMYLLLSQLFWVKKLYFKKSALITLALLLLVLPSQLFLAMVNAVYRNQPVSSLQLSVGNILLEFVLSVIVFIFIIFTIMLAGNKFKKINE